MIHSMTAFANAERIENGLTVAVEIRSYNNRHLDLMLRIPQGYMALEERIKSLVSERVTRGRVELKLQVRNQSAEACAFEVDEIKAGAYHRALLDLKGMLDIGEPVSLAMVAGASGVIKPAETENDLEAAWPLIRDAVADALTGLLAMREREGAHIETDFGERLALIASWLDDIEASSGGLLDHYRDRLKERVTALTQGMVAIDEGRIAQEAAFLADRSDISEEIVRARSHLNQFRALMAGGEAAGRKLNFLLQEFNREFNTMGAKTNHTDVSHRVVDIKSELEKMREQVQNIE